MEQLEVEFRSMMAKVTRILEAEPETRDSDCKLYARIVVEHYPEKAPFLVDELLLGTAPNWETVGRARRKVQESRADLRGELYEKRRGIERDMNQLMLEI